MVDPRPVRAIRPDSPSPSATCSLVAFQSLSLKETLNVSHILIKSALARLLAQPLQTPTAPW